ncbi:pyruvate dehydrogenase complex dihydrolipoamide acetyltransferase [Puniceicoccus vermicola]|uniref:Acetyltransferase component of pyruvate dehydrogenase complex n=1 Tax=Puniceicoccus vermicola TaxID=388746 RepID=A0A7X1AV99_9BACT|nr:pyruvate dehydrogenase complex dihydrolipoamide acetyltransferase [Puniceicoccus vermicola]MBC2600668.1 pyruvate dehydrogenase complex dihydrolipoamide acetyltransferase [Puniceicoccus vermicola]
MAEIIEMPKLSDTMTTGTLVKWLKKEGETVTNGDKLAEVETDKATMELENFDEGVILKCYVSEGDQVEVGAPVCAIGEKGEDAPEVEGSSSGGSSKSESKEEESKDESSDEKDEAPAEEEKEESQESAPESDESDDDTRIKASPLARKIAKENGVKLGAVEGSGPRGRVVKADVLKAMESGSAQQSEAPAAAAASFGAPASGSFPEGEEVKLSGMRSAIARRLLESKTTIPHFYLEIEVDMAPLIALRKSVNEGLADLAPEAGGAKFSVNDLILKASAEALRRVPAVNASWGETKIIRHGGVHLAFAVAVEEGLVTPVVRDAHAKTLRQISAEAKELAIKAKKKKLKPDEMSGSTFTVTNLGMFGINAFFGIINPPNAAILSVGSTVSKPVVDKNGQIVVGQRMNIGISADHRVVDGAIAAQYLAALKEILEAPALMLV